MEDTDILVAELAYDSNTERLQKEQDKKDIIKLKEDTEKLKIIMKDLTEIIDDSGEQILFAERITDDTQETLKETSEHIKKARESQRKANILKGTLISTGIGICIGGPIGGILGNTVNLVGMGTLIGGVSIGGFMGSLTNYILSVK